MKKITFGILALGAMMTNSTFAANGTIALWNFDSLPTTPAASGIAADSGTYAATSFASVNTGGTLSSPAGVGGGKSYSSNGWNVGEYFQFSSSTVGFDRLLVSYAQFGSNTGPKNFQFSYSTDGTTFTNFGSAYAVANAFATNSFDLSAVTALNNVSAVYFRVVDTTTTAINNGTVAAAGTDRIDNFSFTSVPEPRELGIAFVALLGIAVLVRHRRLSGDSA